MERPRYGATVCGRAKNLDRGFQILESELLKENVKSSREIDETHIGQWFPA